MIAQQPPVDFKTSYVEVHEIFRKSRIADLAVCGYSAFFHIQTRYSYFSADLRLRIFLSIFSGFQVDNMY